MAGTQRQSTISKVQLDMYNNSIKTERGYLLIVEDDLDILKLLETTLNFSGYRVVTARNGNERHAMRNEARKL